MSHRTGRRSWLTATLLALAVAGCAGSTTPVARRAPTPTATISSTATPRPTAVPTSAGEPCGQVIGANNPVVARVGDLQFTRPLPYDNVDPLRQLPDSLSNQPYAVNADTRTYLDAFPLVNVHLYTYAICNNSATTSHVVGQFSVMLTAFTADANPINTSRYCIHVYTRQSMVNHTGCGGAFGGSLLLVASFASAAAVGMVQPALDHSGLQVTPLTLQPGYAIPIAVQVTPSTVAGTSTYRFGVGVDGAAPVYPAVDSVAMLNATSLRQWDGDACQTIAMQALIPAATTPPTYYICPPA